MDSRDGLWSKHKLNHDAHLDKTWNLRILDLGHRDDDVRKQRERGSCKLDSVGTRQHTSRDERPYMDFVIGSSTAFGGDESFGVYSGGGVTIAADQNVNDSLKIIPQETGAAVDVVEGTATTRIFG